MQPTTKESEQELANKSFDPVFNVEIVEAVGFDSVNNVLRPIAVDDTGKLKLV